MIDVFLPDSTGALGVQWHADRELARRSLTDPFHTAVDRLKQQAPELLGGFVTVNDVSVEFDLVFEANRFSELSFCPRKSVSAPFRVLRERFGKPITTYTTPGILGGERCETAIFESGDLQIVAEQSAVGFVNVTFRRANAAA